MSSPRADLEFLARSDNRVAVLAALRAGPTTRRDLRETLGVERVTLGRILADFEERAWAAVEDDTYRLTALGEVVATAFDEALETIRAARRLGPVADVLSHPAFDVSPTRLMDATVTEASAGDPYRPVRRFMALLDDSSSLRGYDTTTVAPLYVDDIRENILDGMTTDVVYLPPVAQQIADDYRVSVTAAIDSGNLRLRVAESLPFGLAIFDDRVGIGVYDDSNGVLSVFVDTDDSVVREWATESFERHRTHSVPFLSWPAESE